MLRKEVVGVYHKGEVPAKLAKVRWCRVASAMHVIWGAKEHDCNIHFRLVPSLLCTMN